MTVLDPVLFLRRVDDARTALRSLVPASILTAPGLWLPESHRYQALAPAVPAPSLEPEATSAASAAFDLAIDLAEEAFLL